MYDNSNFGDAHRALPIKPVVSLTEACALLVEALAKLCLRVLQIIDRILSAVRHCRREA